MHSLRDKKTCMALAAGAVLPLAMAGVSSAATVNGTCAAPTGLAFKTATVQTGTMSTTFVDVANTQVTFVQGGTGPNCVVVAFTASANNGPGNSMIVRAVLDDSIICEPKGDTYFSSADDLRGSAMNFVCPSVSPGGHAIKMQFRSLNGGQVAFDHRSTIVHFRK